MYLKNRNALFERNNFSSQIRISFSCANPIDKILLLIRPPFITNTLLSIIFIEEEIGLSLMKNPIKYFVRFFKQSFNKRSSNRWTNRKKITDDFVSYWRLINIQ